eukprot:TRINITY_DN14844_c0_g1_i1.p1 TRINITY_DN14844_c0_g1~~TRINITY_DN14844_c0_g1_i1.p1  ORF type:complete len:318 (-),score=79.48 TRINITY_DN14844_c0_g1_i1:116-1069(-)
MNSLRLTRSLVSSFGASSKRAYSIGSPAAVVAEEWKHRVFGIRDHLNDVVSVSPLIDMSVTLDRDDPVPKPGDLLPASWHLIFFHPHSREKDLAADGYETLYSPPAPFTQRMWAGSSLSFDAANPLRVGQAVRQESHVAHVQLKKGSRGDMIFVTVQNDIHNEQGLSVVEKRELVYMQDKPDLASAKTLADAETAEFQRLIQPTEVLLFRYSALTFNAHRIHYDYKYATETEGYSGLLVHGPLTATLLLDTLRRQYPHRFVTNFSYRALSPLFLDSNPTFTVAGRQAQQPHSVLLWASKNGSLAMRGTAVLSDKPVQ